MNKNEWKEWTGAVGRMLLTFALVYSQGAWAGQNQKINDKVATPQKTAAQQAGEKPPSPAESRTSNRGPHEGIKVHGHWTIEVRNPDGTVVTHREFENSLVPTGATQLSSILAGQRTPGTWSIRLIGNTVEPCLTTAGTGVDCDIYEPAFGATGGPNLFNTLNVSTGAAGSLILSGTAVAGQTGEIDAVQSFEYYCAATVPPASCLSNGIVGNSFFTSAGISPIVNVTIGQTVAVTVSISFS